jgi:hypothetical protein
LFKYLSSLFETDPCFAALSSLKYVNGYNELNRTNYLQDPYEPIPPKGIALFSHFAHNFNFTAALIAAPLLVALIAFALSKTAMKQNPKARTVAERAVGEYAFMGLMFSGYLFTVSFALEALFGAKDLQSLVGRVSVVETSLLMVAFCGYFAFIIAKPTFFGEFVADFKNDKLSSKFYNAMILQSRKMSTTHPNHLFVPIGC